MEGTKFLAVGLLLICAMVAIYAESSVVDADVKDALKFNWSSEDISSTESRRPRRFISLTFAPWDWLEFWFNKKSKLLSGLKKKKSSRGDKPAGGYVYGNQPSVENPSGIPPPISYAYVPQQPAAGNPNSQQAKPGNPSMQQQIIAGLNLQQGMNGNPNSQQAKPGNPSMQSKIIAGLNMQQGMNGNPNSQQAKPGNPSMQPQIIAGPNLQQGMNRNPNSRPQSIGNPNSRPQSIKNPNSRPQPVENPNLQSQLIAALKSQNPGSAITQQQMIKNRNNPQKTVLNVKNVKQNIAQTIVKPSVNSEAMLNKKAMILQQSKPEIAEDEPEDEGDSEAEE